MENEIRELRTSERYVVMESLTGSFGAASTTILDICEHGVQIAHTQPLRIGTTGRLWFKRAEVAASIQGSVVWSQLSQKPDDEGKILYRSGVRIADGSGEFTQALQMLALKGVLRRDFDSLERKRQRNAARSSARVAKPVVKFVQQGSDVPHDQALLIQHTRERLKNNPDEASKWYNRARFAISSDTPPGGAEMLRDREEVLAIWEYLDRSVDLSTIVRVFDRSAI